jgi:hypothetical protein
MDVEGFDRRLNAAIGCLSTLTADERAGLVNTINPPRPPADVGPGIVRIFSQQGRLKTGDVDEPAVFFDNYPSRSSADVGPAALEKTFSQG